MSAVPKPMQERSPEPELHSGDHMTREEFHRIYEQMPEHFKAELIGGIVYVASPLKLRHGTNHAPLSAVMYTYRGHTPGVQLGDNTTVLLGGDSETQPDLFLRILPEYGGQSRTTEADYVSGAPELVAEIAHSSRSIDLYKKREKYHQFGVREYLVLSLEEKRLRWFDLTEDKELLAGDGVVRVKNFPGLWIDAAALLADDYGRLMSVINQGIGSLEHSQFAQQLANKKASNAR